MDTNLSTSQINNDLDSRRSGSDRRDDGDRRRNTRGLFEVRARREADVGDRRSTRSRRDQRDSFWSRLAFWRRDKAATEPVT